MTKTQQSSHHKSAQGVTGEKSRHTQTQEKMTHHTSKQGNTKMVTDLGKSTETQQKTTHHTSTTQGKAKAVVVEDTHTITQQKTTQHAAQQKITHHPTQATPNKAPSTQQKISGTKPHK
ncbi:hypothetical protein L484_012486 [Morus notabilis]|uniref:Uncharacterized protein n=1 Tax=Morus notabilis TaxID=981085 RepID=W9QFB6_9ROSA|nr:hypothetical protein L484_012486 [Morus notabilis]